MSKQKKNSNYKTAKRADAKAEAERKARNKRIVKLVLAIAIPVLVITAIVLSLIFVGRHFGWWDKKPVVTQHAVITISGYDSMHVELYGESAPETVEHFLAMIDKSKYNGIRFDKLIDGRLETTPLRNASDSIVGEFADNGVENNVKFKKGTLVMALTDGPDSANGEFFILTEDNAELEGKYAAFGRIDAESMATFDKMLESIEAGEAGIIDAWKRPEITRIEIHDASDH